MKKDFAANLKEERIPQVLVYGKIRPARPDVSKANENIGIEILNDTDQ